MASAGCAADATSPTAPGVGSRPARVQAVEVQGSRGPLLLQSGDTATYVFTVDPGVPNELRMGGHGLDLPANAVCAVEGSGYGADLWDAPCAPEEGPVTITARVTATASGQPHVHFEPALRFNPRTAVYLSLFVKPSSKSEPLDWRILYCATAEPIGCVDESLLDPDLATEARGPGPLVVRRIKHFSGYMVAE